MAAEIDAARRKSLRDAIAARSFGRGDVTLASGKKSTFYFDMKPTMLCADAVEALADAILALAREANADLVGGLEMGAVPITGAIVLRSRQTGRPIDGFFVRKSAKAHGAQKLIEGLKRGETLAGRRVVIVEDVTTTGGSAMQAIEACEAQGASVALVVTAVDREDGAREAFAARGVPFAAVFSAREFLEV